MFTKPLVGARLRSIEKLLSEVVLSTHERSIRLSETAVAVIDDGAVKSAANTGITRVIGSRTARRTALVENFRRTRAFPPGRPPTMVCDLARSLPSAARLSDFLLIRGFASPSHDRVC